MDPNIGGSQAWSRSSPEQDHSVPKVNRRREGWLEAVQNDSVPCSLHALLHVHLVAVREEH